MPDLESMTLDQQLAVRAARDRLLREFDATLGEPTVDAVLDASWDHMDQSARLKAHVPLLAERFARVQLWAMARTRGHHEGVPAVLFVDVLNAGRARIAKMLFARRTGSHGLSFAAGSEAGVGLEEPLLAAMAEIGIAMDDELTKPYTQQVLDAVDVVVAFGDADAVPVPVPEGTRLEVWDVADPRGASLEQARAMRDDMRARVDALADEMGIPAQQ